MAYTPTTWATGDVVTSEKLNKMETGINNNGLFVVTFTLNDYDSGSAISGSGTADKTMAEIYQAWENGSNIIGVVDGESMGNAVRVVQPMIIGSNMMTFYTEMLLPTNIGNQLLSLMIMLSHSQDVDLCMWQVTEVSIPSQTNS